MSVLQEDQFSSGHSDTSPQTNTMDNEKQTAQAESPVLYSAFTRRQKWILILLVSVAATFSAFASNIYFPALPTIASDLQVSGTLINLTVTSYMIFQGLAPSLWGAFADAHGRRITFICCFIVFLAACIGLANTQNYATLVVLRCIQSTGSASTIALGSGVVGDITTRAERGGMMGVFQAGLLVPVAVGPIIGGVIASSLGWRAIFWFLAIYSGIFLLVLTTAFPETLRSIVGNASRIPNRWIYRFPLSIYQSYHLEQSSEKESATVAAKKRIDLLGPFRILANKQGILTILFLAVHYTVWQMSVTVASSLFASTYGLDTMQIGLTYIGNGAGCILGTLTTGKLLDCDYRRAKTAFESSQAQSSEKGQPLSGPGFSIERARLRLAPVFSLLQCASIIVFGWTIQYRVHISVPIIASFLTGWTAVSITSAVSTYMVDIFPDSSASATAALNLARCLLGAAGTAVVDPMVNGIGAGGCCTVLAGLMAAGLCGLGIQGWTRKRSRSQNKGGNVA